MELALIAGTPTGLFWLLVILDALIALGYIVGRKP